MPNSAVRLQHCNQKLKLSLTLPKRANKCSLSWKNPPSWSWYEAWDGSPSQQCERITATWQSTFYASSQYPVGWYNLPNLGHDTNAVSLPTEPPTHEPPNHKPPSHLVEPTNDSTALSPNNPSDGSYLTETKADDYLLSLEADVEADAVAKDLHEALFAATEPMYYRWFCSVIMTVSDVFPIRRFYPIIKPIRYCTNCQVWWSCPVIAYQNQKTPEQLAIEQAKNDKPSQDNTLVDMPITEHLIELRRHLIHGFAAVLVGFFGIGGLFARNLRYFSAPLTALLPSILLWLQTDITSSFWHRLNWRCIWLVILAMPYILYQIWSFIAQGYISMKTYRLPVLLSSVILFYLGIAFAYYVVLKSVLAFLSNSPRQRATDDRYRKLSKFCTQAVFGVWATFEIPVLTLLLVLAGVVTVDSLAQNAVTSSSVVSVLLRLSPHLMAYRWWC